MRIWLLTLTLLLTACATPESLRNEHSAEMAIYGFTPKIRQSGYFNIFSLEKITDNNLPIRIYIEGDGKAFLANGMISPDPTPGEFVIELIKKDNYPNIIYLARPCQFGLDDNCNEKYWTTSRFAPEVVDAYSNILSGLNHPVELVGYSGGGAIAMILADRNSNIINIRTVAGNIEHNEFNKIHSTPSLEGSLNPVINTTIPQTHFVGTDDNIVPASIAEFYQNSKPNPCSEIIEVKGATHSKNWHEKWADLVKTSPFCREQVNTAG